MNDVVQRILVARCENFREDLGEMCTGTLRYQWGQSQAACDICGGWCGVAVAKWDRVLLEPYETAALKGSES